MNPLYAGLAEGEPTVLVQMINEDTGNEWYFSSGQFEDRLFLMEEAYRDHEYEEDEDSGNGSGGEEGGDSGGGGGSSSSADAYEDDEANEEEERKDPFEHDPDDIVVGVVKVPLDGIAYNQVCDNVVWRRCACTPSPDVPEARTEQNKTFFRDKRTQT